MNNQPVYPAPSRQATSPRRIFIIVMLGLIAVFTTYYVLYLTGRGFNTSESTSVNAPVEKVWDPSGSIYLTLSPIENNSEQNQMGIYKYNFSTNLLSPYYVPKTSPSFASKFQPGTDDILVSVYESPERLQIARVNVEKRDYIELTNSDVSFKRHPVWSDVYDMLIYSGKDNDSDLLTNDYNIYTQSNTGEHKKLAQGAMPNLIPDGKSVVVLRNEGLYKVDLLTGDSNVVWPAKSNDIKTHNQFSLSKDGRYIAWTFPELNELYVMEVTDWVEFKGSIKYIIKAHASWPVFSPDSNYLAFEEFEWGLETNPTDPRLTVVNLMAPNLVTKTWYDLSEFNIQEMFITDWK